MGSPFGLAYGLGSGLANLPGAMRQIEQQKQQAALGKLRLQEAQQQMADEQALNQAGSQPFQPAQEEVETPESQAARAQFAQNKAALSMTPVGINGAGGGMDLSGFAGKEPAKQTKMQDVDYTDKPALRAAQYHQQVADRLRAMGRGRSAMAQDELANKYHQQHLQEGFGNIYRSFIAGDLGGAVKAMNDMGMRGIKSIEPLPPDQFGQTSYRVTRTNEYGQDLETVVPQSQFLMINANPAQAYKAFNANVWTPAKLRQQAQIAGARLDQRERLFGQAEKNKDTRQKNLFEQQKELQAQRLAAQDQRFSGNGGKTPAKVATWDYVESRVRKENPGLSEAEIEDKVAQHPLIATAASLRSSAMTRQHAMKMKEIIFKENGGVIPDPKTEAGRQYLEFDKESRGGEAPRTSPKPKANPGVPPPPPGARLIQ